MEPLRSINMAPGGRLAQAKALPGRPGAPVYAAPVAGLSPRSDDTQGLPDPTSIEEQKKAYCRSTDYRYSIVDPINW